MSRPILRRSRAMMTSSEFESVSALALVDALYQLVARDDHALAQREAGEHAPLECGKAQRQPVELEHADMRVEAERPALHLGVGVAGGAADQRAQAHHQLLEAKRLGQEVVGAGFEAFDLLAPGIARGEDEHRHFDAGRAPRREHREAGHLGQAEIKHAGVVEAGGAEVLAVLAVGPRDRRQSSRAGARGQSRRRAGRRLR